jgi:hypothetical protein
MEPRRGSTSDTWLIVHRAEGRLRGEPAVVYSAVRKYENAVQSAFFDRIKWACLVSEVYSETAICRLSFDCHLV